MVERLPDFEFTSDSPAFKHYIEQQKERIGTQKKSMDAQWARFLKAARIVEEFGFKVYDPLGKPGYSQ